MRVLLLMQRKVQKLKGLNKWLSGVVNIWDEMAEGGEAAAEDNGNLKQAADEGTPIDAKEDAPLEEEEQAEENIEADAGNEGDQVPEGDENSPVEEGAEGEGDVQEAQDPQGNENVPEENGVGLPEEEGDAPEEGEG